MQKNAAYHKAAIKYNEEMQHFAENLALRLDHPEIVEWAKWAAGQYKFHAERHRSGLKKLEAKRKPRPGGPKGNKGRRPNQKGRKMQDDNQPQEPSKEEVGAKTPEAQTPDVDYRDASSGQFVTEDYAKEHPDTTVGETAATSLPATPVENVPDPVGSEPPVEQSPDVSQEDDATSAGVGTEAPQ